MGPLIARIAEIIAAGREAALVSLVSVPAGIPALLGACALFDRDGPIEGSLGSAVLHELIVDDVRRALATGADVTIVRELSTKETTALGTVPAAQLEYFVEVFLPPPTLVILGAGHIAVPLAELGRLLEFEVVVVDDRPAYANLARFPSATRIIVDDFGPALQALTITPRTYLVLVTRGHRYDVQSLRTVIDSPAAYIGMIGSQRRVWTVFLLLRQGGVPAAQIERVRAPIGLDLRAQTPAEIAVSIMAEIIAVRRGGPVPVLSDAVRARFQRRLQGIGSGDDIVDK